MIDYQTKFETGLAYGAFLEKHGTAEHRRRWADVYESFEPTETQRRTLESFVREMNVLCLCGAWCGDCVLQCPLIQRFAEVTSKIQLRFVDRDADAELADNLRICGGSRVPVFVFLSEDFHECGRYGDRTFSRYRELAGQQLGAACPTGLGTSAASAVQVADDWLRESERIQLMLRLSPRLRQKHGD